VPADGGRMPDLLATRMLASRIPTALLRILTTRGEWPNRADQALALLHPFFGIRSEAATA
jgi:hypothetical protein